MKEIARIATHTNRVLEYAAGKSYADFCTDSILYDALVMNIMQIGEHASRLSEDFCERHSGIPWRDMRSVRNRIVHGYDDVDSEAIWQIVQEDLPDLKKWFESL